MKSILEELFYGNICPSMIDCSDSEQKNQLIKHIADHHNNLNSTLLEKQKAILEKFDNCLRELTDLNEREMFTYAFRLGARMTKVRPRPHEFDHHCRTDKKEIHN